jgi:AcrR family transcriptional regulator
MPADTRARLLAAAQKEFNRSGYFGTDTNRIARRAGFAPQTFYRHFADKIAIFLAVYEGWWQDESAALSEVLATPALRDHARQAAKIVLDFHTRWRVFRRSLRHLAIEEPRVRAARAAARLAQIERHASRDSRSTAQLAAALLKAERLCDAHADGELADLGLSRTAALGLVVDAMAELTGRSAR